MLFILKEEKQIWEIWKFHNTLIRLGDNIWRLQGLTFMVIFRCELKMRLETMYDRVFFV